MPRIPTERQQSFDSFVVTRSTAAALSACRSIVEDLSKRAAVCLLHGASGTGKTHLLRAAAGEARRRGYRVRESTAVELRASLVESIRRNADVLAASPGFDADLLVVDGLQALASHPASQDAIADLFRKVVARRTSTLAASGVAASALPAFTRALGSEPSYRSIPLRTLSMVQLRKAVESIAAAKGLPLSPDTAQIIAERSRGDFGMIHGLLVQLEAAMRWPSTDATVSTVVRLYPVRVER